MTCNLCQGTRFVTIGGEPGAFFRDSAPCPTCTVTRNHGKAQKKRASEPGSGKKRASWRKWEATLDKLSGSVGR